LAPSLDTWRPDLDVRMRFNGPTASFIKKGRNNFLEYHMQDLPAKSAIVTTRQAFLKTDGHHLFTVRAGVPVELALEQACILLDCTQRVVLNRENLGADIHTNCLQYLTDMTRALVNASAAGLAEYERTL
jgi:hypothetical protein